VQKPEKDVRLNVAVPDIEGHKYTYTLDLSKTETISRKVFDQQILLKEFCNDSTVVTHFELFEDVDGKKVAAPKDALIKLDNALNVITLPTTPKLH
jgi:hypothetical protein